MPRLTRTLARRLLQLARYPCWVLLAKLLLLALVDWLTGGRLSTY